MDSMESYDKKKEWSKSITVNGFTKSLHVEELDNGGYLVKYSKYGKPEGSEEYIDICKKYYSEKNPLGVEKQEEDSMSLDDIYNFVGISTTKGL